MMLIDQCHDLSGAITHELTQIYGSPDFVKKASRAHKLGDPSTLPAMAYAGPNNTFPTHTKAATWLSAAFLAYNEQQHPEVDFSGIKSKLSKVAAVWKIADEVEHIFSQVKSAANVGVVYALEFTEDGVAKKAFPMRNAKEVQAAASLLLQNREKMSFELRQVAAERVVQQAIEFHADIDMPAMHKMAGIGFSATEVVVGEWEKRAVWLADSHPETSDSLLAMADSVRAFKLDARDTSMRNKLAATMEQLDRDFKLTGLYGTKLRSPEDTFFEVTFKQAAALQDSIFKLTNGDVFQKSALAGVTTEHIQNWFGDDLADMVKDPLSDMIDHEKLAEVARTLPRPDANAFSEMLAAHAQKPEVRMPTELRCFQ